MIKHDNYENPCELKIYKKKNGSFTWDYKNENQLILGNKEELLAEISEYLDNIKGE